MRAIDETANDTFDAADEGRIFLGRFLSLENQPLAKCLS
jgi:hypothetical protein